MPKDNPAVELPTIGVTIDWKRLPAPKTEKRRMWQAEVGALVNVAHLLAMEAFGDRGAQELMKQISRRKPGRKPSTRFTLQEYRLIDTYNTLLAGRTKPREDIYKKTGEHLYKGHGNRYGASPEAITQKIRRLV